MSIRLKLLLTGIVMAVLVAGICIIGYITAERALTASISGEINAVLSNECSQLDGICAKRGNWRTQPPICSRSSSIVPSAWIRHW